jgi:ribonuclease HII
MTISRLLEKVRERLRPIIEQEAICFSVSHLESDAIDEINIVDASIKAIQENVLKLEPQPESIIVHRNTPYIHKGGKFIPQPKLKFLALFPVQIL